MFDFVFASYALLGLNRMVRPSSVTLKRTTKANTKLFRKPRAKKL